MEQRLDKGRRAGPGPRVNDEPSGPTSIDLETYYGGRILALINGQPTVIEREGLRLYRGPQLYYYNRAAEAALKSLTGQNLGVVPEGWRDWWQEHGVELVRREQARERGNQKEAEDLIDQAQER